MESLHTRLVTKAKAEIFGLKATQLMWIWFIIELENCGLARISEAIESNAIDVVRAIRFVVDVV